jgi:DNA-binding CsgD family transcriptional regulator
MIKEIKINSGPDVFDLQECSDKVGGDDLVSIILALDKCDSQYCILIDVIESHSYAAYKHRLRQISVLLEQLTKRESEVLRLVIKGMSNKAISEDLSISLETVKSHRKKIVSKIGLQKVTDLLNIFYNILIKKTVFREINKLDLYAENVPAVDVHLFEDILKVPHNGD